MTISMNMPVLCSF